MKIGKGLYLKTCVVCGKQFIVDGRHHKKITCSEECRRERIRMQQREYYRTKSGKSYGYGRSIREYLKDKPDDKIIYELRKAIIKLDVIDKILKERGIDVKKVLEIKRDIQI